MSDAKRGTPEYDEECERIEQEMTPQQIMSAAGTFGPSLIGEPLYDMAKKVRVATYDGKLGPAITGTGETTPDISVWEGWSRAKLLELARKAELAVKSNTNRDDLAEALVKANISPPSE